MKLRREVLEALERHGLTPGEGDTPATLKERLNDLYLEEVRQLRQRQASGEIPLGDYARRVEELKERFPLLGLPLSLWGE